MSLFALTPPVPMQETSEASITEIPSAQASVSSIDGGKDGVWGPVELWGVAEVSSWLERIDLDIYVKALRERGVDGAALIRCVQEHLILS